MSDHGAAHGDDHGESHGDHGAHGHGPEIWETSIWPVAAALGAIITGLCLIWNAKDGSNDFAGPMAGAALVATVGSVAAWIWERRKRAEEEAKGHDIHGPNPRNTQVLTFTIPAGQLAAARADGGVIHALESSDLSDIGGFQDFRITVSPADDGPSQVLVETTWEDREGLAAYNASRENLLTVLSGHDEQVLPGTVQAFDMEVVRDTKLHSYRFPMSAALAIVGGLVAGGFLFGAAQSIFVEETVVADGAPEGDPFLIVASDNSFNRDTLTAPPDTEVTFTLQSVGVNPHNLSFYETQGGTAISTGEIQPTAGTVTETFTTPGPGTYYFQCDVHPGSMSGTFEVVEGAPGPGGSGGGSSSSAAIVATDNEYDVTSLTATAGQPFTVTFSNEGKSQHNLTFVTEEGGEALADGAHSGLLATGASETLTFTVDEPGSYYYFCEVHPTEMFGTLEVSPGSEGEDKPESG